ncbi:MAG: YihY family inner membrane protein [Planctomycetota bacterium]|nr:YihY family inner membrane protein [Planctomycetota bacterium]
MERTVKPDASGEAVAGGGGKTGEAGKSFREEWVIPLMAGVRVAWDKARRDQGPLRASALAYATLVSLVPTVAILMAILSAPAFERSREEFLDRLTALLIPDRTGPAVGKGTGGGATGEGAEGGTGTGAAACAGTDADAGADAGGNTGSGAKADAASGTAAPGGPTSAIAAAGALPASKTAQERFKRLFREQIGAITANMGTVGTIGFLALLATVYLLMNAVEKTFNHIWEVRSERTFFQKIAVYTAIIFWAPIMAMLSFSLTGYLKGTGLGVIAPTILMALAFTGVFAVIPNAGVRARPAFLGGLVTAVLWEAAKLGFVWYVVHVAGQYKLYGSLGVLPMLFVWVYVNWLVVLFGCEIAYCVQHLDDMRLHARVLTMGKGMLLPVGLRLAAEAAARFSRGEAPLTVERAAAELKMPPAEILRAADMLCEGGVLARIRSGSREAWTPAAAPAAIPVANVLDALGWPVPPRPDASAWDGVAGWDAIHSVLADAERGRREALKDISLETLAFRLGPAAAKATPKADGCQPAKPPAANVEDTEEGVPTKSMPPVPGDGDKN